jgi:hypothetical protein
VAGVAGPADGVPDHPDRPGETGENHGSFAGVGVLEREAEEREQRELGGVGHQVLAQGLPLLGRQVPRHERKEGVLLVVEVLHEHRPVLDERGHEGVAFVGSGGLLPGGHGGVEPAEGGGDPLVLGLHAEHYLGVQIDPDEQGRPEKLVLAVVMVVQSEPVVTEVVGEYPGAGGVARGDRRDEFGEQPRLAAEGAVDDHHLVGVDGLVVGGDRGEGRGVQRAGRRAGRGRYAHDVAVALLTDAVASFDRIPRQDRDPSERVDLLGRQLRAQVRAGAVAAARATRQRAVEFAESVHRDDLMIAAFTAWTEPTPWQARPYGVVDQPIVTRLSRLLARPDLNPADRCRLLEAYSHELIGEADPTARAAAEEALALSATLGDPRLRASAIAAVARDQNDVELPGRADLCRELTEIGIEHDLPAYRVTGLLAQANAAAAMNDVPALHRLIGETLELARAYRMAEAVSACECTLATFAHIEGRFDEAEQLYTETAERMARHGSLHAAGYLQLALAAIQASRGRIAEFVPAAQALLDDHGPFAADLLAVALAAASRTEEARRIRKQAVAIRPDFFFALFATLRAMAVVALGERDAAAELYATLLPHRNGPPAGATSLSVALRPVAHTLGELALLLDRDDEAADHFTRSVTIAELWGATHWATEAREALAALESRPARPPRR